MTNPLRRRLACLLLSPALAVAGCGKSNPPAATPAADRTDPPLPTGRWIASGSPTTSQAVGSLPVNMVLSPDGKYAITSGAGAREQLCSVRVADGSLAGKIEFRGTPSNKTHGLYYGLAFGPDGTLYAGMGGAKKVAVVKLAADGSLDKEREIECGETDFPAGVAVDASNRLYVTHNDPAHTKGAAFGMAASVSVHDAATGKELGRYAFKDDVGLSNFPLAVAVNADGSRLYVASERDAAVYVLDASNPADIKLRAALPTGSHPLALLRTKDGRTLYVANAHSDTVSVVDTAADKIVGTILLRPQIAKDLAGATPTGLALSANDKFLYVTLGDMNAVAVVDVKDATGPELEGYIPVGWYPTAVAVVDNHLLVANAKGDKARIPTDFTPKTKSVASPLRLFEGTVWRVPVPNKAQLAELTDRSIENSRLLPKHLGADNPLKGIGLQAGKIKHVIYVVKENRTYDHVLGDLPQGNGDPNRCLFPRDVTPNQHALAERFVLMDNFYDSGDVSGDGWTWSTQAQANEYVVRNVPYSYSGRGRSFDYEGQVNDYPAGGFPATRPDGKPMSDDPRFKAGAKAVPDVAAAPGGHLWDLARKQGLTIRNYGFFSSNGITEKGKVVIPDNVPTAVGLQPAGHDLDGVTDIDFRRFDMNYPDSDAPHAYAAKFNDPAYHWPLKAYGRANAPSRFSQWKREFDLMLAKDPTGGAVPNLMLVRFPTDHTSGASSGRPSPRCMVADNDYAVGQLVEAVSKSPIWTSCAIVIIEDDAQNGPDHVDAHRSTCYVVSPWMKRGSVDRSFQNTVSALKTIECLLGLPPMCQYDAASGVIGNWDDAPRNAEPFVATPPKPEYMKERNSVVGFLEVPSPEAPKTPATNPTTVPATVPATGPATRAAIDEDRPLNTPADLAIASSQMDFEKADKAPAHLLNRVLWKAVKGFDTEMPPTPRTIKPVVAGEKDDDDDD